MKNKVNALEVLIIGFVFINYYGLMSGKGGDSFTACCGVFYFVSERIISLYKERKKE